MSKEVKTTIAIMDTVATLKQDLIRKIQEKLLPESQKPINQAT